MNLNHQSTNYREQPAVYRSGQRLQLLLVSRDQQALARLKTIISEAADRYDIDTRLVGNGHRDPLSDLPRLPDLLVLHLSHQWPEELAALEERSGSERPAFVAIASDGDPAAMRQAMRAGARDFLTEPLADDELLDALQRLTQEELSRRRQSKGQLTACINAKGGSGATMLACNLAHIMQVVGKQDVVLMDLDIQFGALAHYLDLHPTNGVLEALELVEELDTTALEAYLIRHDSGLRVMGTTLNQVLLPQDLSGERVSRLLELVQHNCDHLVVDLPRIIDMMTAAVIEHADKIVMVVQQDLINLQDATRLLNILRHEFGVLDQQILVVINRYNKHAQISMKDIRSTLKIQQLLPIPNDYKHVIESLNSGVPLHALAKRAAITRALTDLEHKLLSPEAPHGGGLFARVFARLTGA